jgi:hypothetical protein
MMLPEYASTAQQSRLAWCRGHAVDAAVLRLRRRRAAAAAQVAHAGRLPSAGYSRAPLWPVLDRPRMAPGVAREEAAEARLADAVMLCQAA